jgi:hypothetical protein
VVVNILVAVSKNRYDFNVISSRKCIPFLGTIISMDASS